MGNIQFAVYDLTVPEYDSRVDFKIISHKWHFQAYYNYLNRNVQYFNIHPGRFYKRDSGILSLSLCRETWNPTAQTSFNAHKTKINKFYRLND